MPSRGAFCAAAVAMVCLTGAPAASAQNYSLDARQIALGGTGGAPNLASKLVEDERRFRSVLIPLGLVRILKNIRVFYPNRDDFDFAQVVDFSTRPLHMTFKRSQQPPERSFFRDIVNSSVARDLRVYGGFDVSESIRAEGLLLENWGKTFEVQRGDNGFHGIYVGAGPYLAAQADGAIDAQLARILSGETFEYVPFASFGATGGEVDQLALAATVGYRSRFAFPWRSGPIHARDGLYLAVNYHTLWGLRLDQFHASLRLDTDKDGLLSDMPAGPPLQVFWETSSSGWGKAIDLGSAVVVGRWDFGVGVSGIGNEIEWSNITRRSLALDALIGGEFESTKRKTREHLRNELPVTYVGNIAYHRENWSALAEYAKGLQGRNIRTGFEYRLGSTELRGGMRDSNGTWFPSVGIGQPFTRRWSVDVAAFTSRTFLEQKRQVSIAVSLRLRLDPDTEPEPDFTALGLQ